MKFFLVWNIKQGESDIRDRAVLRFLKTGGMPPNGATLVARYFRADFMGGFNVIETDDPTTLSNYALDWTDLLDAHYYPVLEDLPMKTVLKARYDSTI